MNEIFRILGEGVLRSKSAWCKVCLRISGLGAGGGKRRWVEEAGARHFAHGDSPDIVSSPLGNVNIPDVVFHELMFQNFSLWGSKTALQCGATGRKYNYRNVMRHSKAMAAAFQNRFKMEKGDFLAIILPNCPEYIIVFLACSQCGVVLTTVNPLYTLDEITWQLQDCKAKLIVTDVKNYEKCVAVAKGLNRTTPVIALKSSYEEKMPEGAVDLFELYNPSTSGGLKPVSIRQEDLLVVPYSSGTTGAPKGVILSHKNLVSNLSQVSHPETLILTPTTRFQQDTVLGVLPMFHIYGLTIITFLSLLHGCRLITLPRFNPKLYMTSVVKKRVNILYVVPPLLTMLASRVIPAKYFRTVSYIVVAAAPMISSDAYKLLEKAEHVKLAQGYGMTESSPALAHTSPKRMQKLTSIGVPVASTKLKISSIETGEPLQRGAQGELRAWGPQVMSGYFNRPEETKNAFDEEGWLKTGDIGYCDEDGDFFLVERMKDLIKVKGFQVAPAELEEVLRMHPKIKDAAVVGVPDSVHGEVPRAFVVLKKDVEMSEDEVKDFIKQKLSPYKHLKGGVKFLDDLPKNNTGKVLRRELKKLD